MLQTESMSWIMNNPSFNQWTESTVNAVLHIDGKPGSGITLLSSYIMGFLKTDLVFRKSVLLKYTATSFGTSSLQLTVTLLSLSHQILAQRPALFHRVSWLCSWLFNDPGVIFTKSIAYSLLSALLNLLDEPIFCIIENIYLMDGPSKCEQLLIDVATAKNSTSPLRILVTTESYMHAYTQEALYNGQGTTTRLSMLNEQGVAYLPLHLQSEQAMFASIEQLVQEGIFHLTEEKPLWAEFKEDIREKLCIEGTTQLLAMHQIDLLQCPVPPTTKVSLKQMLEDLPFTLEDVCTQALSSASGDTKKEKRALLALCWIAFAFRPLEVREAAIALAFDNESIDSIHLLKESMWNDSVGDLSVILGPLLRVVGNHLYPIHHAIKALPVLASESRAFHLRALVTCLKYLRIILKESFMDNIEQTSANKMRISFEKPECELLRYSSLYWPDHLCIVFSNEPCWGQDADAAQRTVAINLTYEFVKCKPLLDAWARAYNIFAPDNYGREAVDLFDMTGLTVACNFGLLPIAQKYASDNSICISNAEFANALDIAACFGRADIVKWLLSKGTLSTRAIYLASIGGHVDVIKELVQKDS